MSASTEFLTRAVNIHVRFQDSVTTWVDACSRYYIIARTSLVEIRMSVKSL